MSKRNFRTAPCSVEGCGNLIGIGARGICGRHYQKMRKHGDPMKGKDRTTPEGAPVKFIEAAKEYFGDECLMWPYAHVRGRAHVNVDGRFQYVSRLICEHAYGPPTSTLMEAAHSCGRGQLGCIARNHLRWATPKENANDKVTHGTDAKGERNTCAKLSVENVLEIRRLWPDVSPSVLADRFGVGRTAIDKIVHRTRWAHV